MDIEEIFSSKLSESFSALSNFNRVLAEDLPTHPQDAGVFICGIYSLHRTAPAGILHLAARLSDALTPRLPFHAHAMAAWILDAAVDEYGLRGGETHTELLARFGEAFGVQRNVMASREHSPRASVLMEENMNRWFRESPVDFALGVHLGSELTSRREFSGWLQVLGDSNHPGWEYLRVHCAVEDGHVGGLTEFTTKWLEIWPKAEPTLFKGIEAYDTAYADMFHEMAKQITLNRQTRVRMESEFLESTRT
jgi:hypothetical protein